MLCKVGIIYSNWAMDFRLDMAPLCFLPAGNCLLKVSYSAWYHRVSYRQETVREGFPIRHDAIVFLADRKLFADSFLLGMALLFFLPTRNYSPGDFSTPLEMTGEAWQHCVSCQQKTVCERFPIRHGITVFLADRKLFAKGFLFDMAPSCFIATGNFSLGDFSTPLEMTEGRGSNGGMAAGNWWRRFSCSVWHHRVSLRQETFCG